jgi:hypothetical protein|tara:strand:- start:477 stop:749 length:273 start_codon:yes stop_codon:yes gene_type:complete
MKITKEKLVKLIKEELEAGTQEGQPENEQPEEKKKSDVKRVLNYISTIDNAVEYQQLLLSILKHGANIPRAKTILTKFYRQLPNFIKTLK